MIKALRLKNDTTIVCGVICEDFPYLKVLEPVIIDFYINEYNIPTVFADKYLKLNEPNTPVNIDLSDILVTYEPSETVIACYLKFKDDLNDRYKTIINSTYLQTYDLQSGNRLLH